MLRQTTAEKSFLFVLFMRQFVLGLDALSVVEKGPPIDDLQKIGDVESDTGSKEVEEHVGEEVSHFVFAQSQCK